MWWILAFFVLLVIVVLSAAEKLDNDTKAFNADDRANLEKIKRFQGEQSAQKGFNQSYNGSHLAKLAQSQEKTNLQNMFNQVTGKLLSEQAVILDTETTGLTVSSEIVEIAIIDTQGNTLFNSLIKPKLKMKADSQAVKVHGITNEMLADAPSWAEVHDEICSILRGKEVVIYNADYDIRLIKQTCDKYKLPPPIFAHECVMKLYGAWHGEKSIKGEGFRWHKLDAAMLYCGIAPKGRAHRALTDCHAVLDLIRHLYITPIQPRNSVPYWRSTGYVKPAEITAPNPDGKLNGEVLVMTGAFSVPRSEMKQIALRHGCAVRTQTSGKTTLLLLGKQDKPSIIDGVSECERDARRRIEEGQNLRILSEEEWMKMIGEWV